MSGEISKDVKERQLDAKIAAIRTKNEEKLQRQREVERDRKQAEKQNQSVTTAPRVKSGGEEYHEPHFNTEKTKLKQKIQGSKWKRRICLNEHKQPKKKKKTERPMC